MNIILRNSSPTVLNRTTLGSTNVNKDFLAIDDAYWKIIYKNAFKRPQ